MQSAAAEDGIRRRPATISAAVLAHTLTALGVSSPSVLMVHADVRACLRVEGATPAAKLETIVGALGHAAGQGPLVMPTFTYSFCKKEPFDVERTPSTVGALSEYFRRLPGVRRTRDPIFSSAILGSVPPDWERRLFSVGDVDCFGEYSIFSYLREVNATFVFLGVDLGVCTFIHHVEQRHRVDYRYLKDFEGVVHDAGASVATRASYFVRRLDGSVELLLYPLQEALLAAGRARSMIVPSGPRVLVTDADSIESVAVAEMRTNPSFLLRRGHAPPA